MSVTSGQDPDDFNYFAGISAYQAARDALARSTEVGAAHQAAKKAAETFNSYVGSAVWQADVQKSLSASAERLKSYTASAQSQIDASNAAKAAIERMRQQLGSLDSINRLTAAKAVRANEDWLEAEKKKAEAAAAAQQDAADPDARENDIGWFVEQEQAQSRIEEWLGVMQGIHTESKASAQSLKAISAAHALAERRQVLADQRQALADRRQSSQDKFNKGITAIGLGVAGASLLASVVMPVVENFIWKADEAKDAEGATSTTRPSEPAAEPLQSSAPSDECRADLPPARYLSCLAPIAAGP